VWRTAVRTKLFSRNAAICWTWSTVLAFSVRRNAYDVVQTVKSSHHVCDTCKEVHMNNQCLFRVCREAYVDLTRAALPVSAVILMKYLRKSSGSFIHRSSVPGLVCHRSSFQASSPTFSS
jgi:hypothetical protein